jgi:hypothetical protein
MKKLKFYILLPQKFCQLLKISSNCTFFINCSKMKCGTCTYGMLLSVEQLTFFCQAVDILKKSVEQSRFEQMTFKQLTPSSKRGLIIFFIPILNNSGVNNFFDWIGVRDLSPELLGLLT